MEILRTIGYGTGVESRPVTQAMGLMRKYRRSDVEGPPQNFANERMLMDSLREWMRSQGHDETTIENAIREFFRGDQLDIRQPPGEM